MATGDTNLDLGVLRDWIGRAETVEDAVSPRLEASFRAVLDRPVGDPAPGEAASPMVHWCLTPPVVPMAELGEDGHPRRGGFLPPVPLPRRMWAGGELTFHDSLRVGDVVTRRSRVEDVVVKTGRSGTLCFVTVRHDYRTARGNAIEERQDIVYREATGASPAVGQAKPEAPPAPWRRAWTTDPVLLFRYSALTFNGHRIHYDQPYATAVEGYTSLVVHGPFQATALLLLAIEARGMPRRFAFRGLAPLIVSRPFETEGREAADGLALLVRDDTGRTTMQATATW